MRSRLHRITGISSSSRAMSSFLIIVEVISLSFSHRVKTKIINHASTYYLLFHLFIAWFDLNVSSSPTSGHFPFLSSPLSTSDDVVSLPAIGDSMHSIGAQQGNPRG